MATFVFKGMKEHGGIPPHSKVRVEALPKRLCVFSGHVTKSLALELDPGKYAFKVGNFPEGKPGIKYSGEFLWGITQEEYDFLKDLKPKAMKVVNTSEGVRYICGYTACDQEFTSRIGAVLHESEHQGQKLIATQGDEDYLPPKLIPASHLRALKAKAQRDAEKRLAEREAQMEAQLALDDAAEAEKNEKARKDFRVAQRKAE